MSEVEREQVRLLRAHRTVWRAMADELAEVLGECTFTDPELAMNAFRVLCDYRALKGTT